MLTEQPILITSIKCQATEGLKKNYFVSFDGRLGADGQKSLGICNADTDFNEMVPVAAKGIALVYTGSGISLGAGVQSFDDGKAVPLDAGPLEGYAMDAATGAGELIRILLV